MWWYIRKTRILVVYHLVPPPQTNTYVVMVHSFPQYACSYCYVLYGVKNTSRSLKSNNRAKFSWRKIVKAEDFLQLQLQLFLANTKDNDVQYQKEHIKSAKIFHWNFLIKHCGECFVIFIETNDCAGCSDSWEDSDSFAYVPSKLRRYRRRILSRKSHQRVELFCNNF